MAENIMTATMHFRKFGLINHILIEWLYINTVEQKIFFYLMYYTVQLCVMSITGRTSQFQTFHHGEQNYVLTTAHYLIGRQDQMTATGLMFSCLEPRLKWAIGPMRSLVHVLGTVSLQLFLKQKSFLLSKSS